MVDYALSHKRLIGMIQTKKNKDSGKDTSKQTPVRVETEDLMKKLMSGETLSTDELMALQRGS